MEPPLQEKGEVKAINCTTTSNQLLSPSFLVYYFLLGRGEEERRDHVIGGAGLGDQEAAKYSKWARGGRGGGRGGGRRAIRLKKRGGRRSTRAAGFCAFFPHEQSE